MGARVDTDVEPYNSDYASVNLVLMTFSVRTTASVLEDQG